MPIQFEPLKKWYGEQLWTEYMNEQNENVDLLNEKLELLETSESVRDANEIARETAEGIRDDNEEARDAAELLRISAETARDTAEGIRESNESARKSAETIRESAETARGTAYGLAEDARDGLYAAAEGDRDNQYGLAEGARDGLYATAEDARNTAFNTAENTRNAAELVRIANEGDREDFFGLLQQMLADGDLNGKDLEFNWSGTKLGVRLKGDTNYAYVDLKGDTGDISNLTAQHIASALGFTPIEYTAGSNVSIDPLTGEISATDTVTTINDKTGAIAKADITALGIPAQDTTYTAGTNIEIASGVIKNIVTDQGTDPDWAGVKYKWVMIDGELFAEVVEV